MYGVPMNSVLAWNNLNKRSIIYPGDRLTIYIDEDYSGGSPDAGDGSFDYTVRRGDTLWQIARQYGTTVSHILRINNLGSTRIHPGDILRVPSAEKEPSSR